MWPRGRHRSATLKRLMNAEFPISAATLPQDELDPVSQDSPGNFYALEVWKGLPRPAWCLDIGISEGACSCYVQTHSAVTPVSTHASTHRDYRPVPWGLALTQMVEIWTCVLMLAHEALQSLPEPWRSLFNDRSHPSGFWLKCSASLNDSKCAAKVTKPREAS